MTRSGSSSRIVLDTSAYSALRVGNEVVLDAIASSTAVLLPAIVLGELEAGFRLGSHEKSNLQVLEEFLEEPFVGMLAVTRDVSLQYGKVFSELRRAGTPIPTNDIWIAACTMAAGATLVTLDTDFEKVKGLSCVVI